MDAEEKQIPVTTTKRSFNSDNRLRLLAAIYEDRYFKDVRMEVMGLKNRYFKHQIEHDGRLLEVYDDSMGDTGISIMHKYVFLYQEMGEENKNLSGLCDVEKREIWVNSETVTTDEDIELTLLHEMIHGYEGILPENYRQLLVLFLYEKLAKRIGKRKLDRFMKIDQNSILLVHTPLFLLKSLTIDLARRLPLGTIYAYRREEMFG